MLIITRRWFFHRPGRNAQESNTQRDAGASAGACPIDKSRRPNSRKEGMPFAGRFYPAGANEHNTLSAWAKKRDSQNWGWATSNVSLTKLHRFVRRMIVGKIARI